MKNAAQTEGGIGGFGYKKWKTTVTDNAGTRPATGGLLVPGVRKGQARGGVC